MFDESIKSPITSNNSLAPVLSYIGIKKKIEKFDGSCLKQDEVTFTHGVYIYIYSIFILFMK